MGGTGLAFRGGGGFLMRITVLAIAVLLLFGVVQATQSFCWDGWSKVVAGDSAHMRKDRGAGTKQGSDQSVVSKPSRGARVNAVSVLKEVARGWRGNDPTPIGKYLGKRKVRLDFGEGGPRGGLFTKSQAYYLISDYLKRSKTVDLNLLKISSGQQKTQKPYIVIERIYRGRNGKQGREVIFVSLVPEGDSWVISELRAIPAR